MKKDFIGFVELTWHKPRQSINIIQINIYYIHIILFYMTLQQLEYIAALDTYRHYVTAAEKCHISQPNLTMQVRKLEEELGLRLFDRQKKPLEVTAAGQIIVTKARQVLREAEHIREFAKSERESLQGRFNLGIIPTLAPYLLPLFLPTFAEKYPEIELNIIEKQSSGIIDDLESGALDMALLVTPLGESGIREIPLFYEPFLIYLPPSHELRKKKLVKTGDLEPSELLVLDEGHCFREQSLSICGKAKKMNTSPVAFQSGSIEALKGLVRKGMGATLVPELSLNEHMDKGYVRRFESPEPVREVSIAVHNSFPREAILNAMHDCIIENIAEDFKKVERYIRVKWR